MNEAPLLRVHSTSPRLFNLQQVYGAWAEHFQKCVTCNATEWYDPDIERLCQQGRLLMANWKLAAVMTPVSALDLR